MPVRLGMFTGVDEIFVVVSPVPQARVKLVLAPEIIILVFRLIATT
jgi:hypothetical protein